MRPLIAVDEREPALCRESRYLVALGEKRTVIGPCSVGTTYEADGNR